MDVRFTHRRHHRICCLCTLYDTHDIPHALFRVFVSSESRKDRFLESSLG